MIELDLEKFTPVIQDAINFLVPYFKINERQLNNFPQPKIKLSQKKYPYYDPRENKLFFHKEDFRSHKIIGHEIGHYLHFHLNPAFWNDGIGCDKWKTLLENCVAYYAENIYRNQGNIFKTPIINLSTLARKDYYFYSNKYSQRKLKSLATKLELINVLKSINIT